MTASPTASGLPPLFLRAVLGLIGFTAITAQIVLMREVMVVFYGNEISLGVMLACWLLWTALGSNYLGRFVARRHDPRRLIAGLQVALALVFPGTILALRSSRNVLHALPGEILGPADVFLTCLVVLSCFCMLSGWLFVAGSLLYEQESRSSRTAATGSMYLLEAAGSALGGILAGLILIRYFNSIQIALIVALLNLLAATYLALRTPRRIIVGVLALGSFLFFIVPFGGRRLETTSLARLWPAFRLVDTRNSVYGNLAVVETKGTRSLFENGLLMFNAPDVAAAEEAVHWALLEHPEPKTLLLIGGGASGSLAQALQHPSLERVDYVELDPAVLDIAQRQFPEQWAAARADPRVHVHHADGRLFLKASDLSFDIILVNLPDPLTAQLNRFYTLEFFREAAEKLNAAGLLSFQLRGAEEYISPELGRFLRCINKTLRQVFPEVVAIPGETVHFFAARQAGTLTSNPQELLSRLHARHIQTKYVREYYVPFRMMPDRMLDLEQQLEPLPDTPVNRDLEPIAYYFDVALWTTQFHSDYRHVFDFIASIDFRRLIAWSALVLLVSAMVLRWLPRPAKRRRVAAVFCVASVGLTLISLEVLLLLGFQAIYGYVYHQLAVLTAFFMVGIAAGSWLGLRHVSRLEGEHPGHREMLLLAALQFAAALSPLILYVIFTSLGGVRSPLALTLVTQVLFPMLALLSGMLGGYQFPIASRVFFSGSGSTQTNLGTLYAVDLAGACLGALVLSAYALPVFGFLRAGILIAVVDLTAGLLAGSMAWAQTDSPN